NPLSLNRYGYTHGNPVNGTDPSGMFLLEQAAVNRIIATLAAMAAVNYSRSSTFAANQASSIINVREIEMEYLLLDLIPHKNDRRIRGLPVIVWGLDYGVTTVHNYESLHGKGFTNPRGTVIQPLFERVKSDTNSRNEQGVGSPWYNQFSPCDRRNQFTESLVCDEFPYASVKGGGYDNYRNGTVAIALVPSAEQLIRGDDDSQGKVLGRFYRDTVPVGSKFLVFANINTHNSYYLKPTLNGLPSVVDITTTIYNSSLKYSDFFSTYQRFNGI
ncbi:MAG: hypothetical protein ACKPCM_09110, partial [Pseudanabaena sp.]